MAGINHKPKKQSPPTGTRQERRLKVSSILSDQTSKTQGKTQVKVPWIRMQGKWLEQAGFEIRTSVRIRVMTGCLVLTTE